MSTINIRPHTETDALNTIEFKDYYVILPSVPIWDVEEFMNAFGGKRCPCDFKYSSGTNTVWLTVEEIRHLIKLHVDSNFVL